MDYTGIPYMYADKYITLGGLLCSPRKLVESIAEYQVDIQDGKWRS